jgi:hypothetical protein
VGVLNLETLRRRREIQRVDAEFDRRRAEIDESYRKARENQELLFQGQYRQLAKWRTAEMEKLK